ncbi:unnamed protein product [Calypogeia fissa]
MDTSAEENQSRDMDSSGEGDHEQGGDITDITDITEAHVEELGFPNLAIVIDPEPHRCSTPFYSFTSASHQLMVSSIMACKYATAAEIVEADPSFSEAVVPHDDMLPKSGAGIECKWKVFQDRLQAQVDGCGDYRLFFKTSPDKLIPHMGQWQEIVKTFHAYIASCPICNPREKGGVNSPSFLEGKRAKPPKFTFPVQLEIPVKVLPQKLEALAIEHKVVLRVLHSKRIAPCPFLSEVVSYICHRGQFKRLREKKERSILEKRRCRASFRCGCNFRIKTLIPITNYFSETGSYDYQTDGTAIVLLNPVHFGHEPGSEADLLHLPVHPSAIRECEEDRHDMKDIHAIIRSSLRKSPLLKAQASKLEQATFRFFLTKKETQRLPYYRKSKEKMLKDMTGDMHSKHYEAGTARKVDSPQHSPPDMKDTVSSINGVGDSYWQRTPARRLGFQKVLAELTDGRQTQADTDLISVENREAEASIYYSRHKQVTCNPGRQTARRNAGTQMRWTEDSDYSEYPERYGRDSSRLDLVNKGISQLYRLQLSEKMELDMDIEKPLEEAGHVTPHEQDGLERELKKHAGDLRFDQRDGECLGETLNYSVFRLLKLLVPILV